MLQEKPYGAVASVPNNTPSTLKLTETTPTLSLAFTCTEAIPDTVLPAVGVMMLTTGGAVSGITLPTVTAIKALALLPAAWLWAQLKAQSERWALAAAFVLAAPIVFYGVRMGEGDFGPAFYILGSHVVVGALIFYALLTKARARLAP